MMQTHARVCQDMGTWNFGDVGLGNRDLGTRHPGHRDTGTPGHQDVINKWNHFFVLNVLNTNTGGVEKDVTVRCI